MNFIDVIQAQKAVKCLHGWRNPWNTITHTNALSSFFELLESSGDCFFIQATPSKNWRQSPQSKRTSNMELFYFSIIKPTFQVCNSFMIIKDPLCAKLLQHLKVRGNIMLTLFLIHIQPHIVMDLCWGMNIMKNKILLKTVCGVLTAPGLESI